MNELLTIDGSLWLHKKSGSMYILISDNAIDKEDDSRTCVYVAVDDKVRQLCHRNYDNFMNKFEKVVV